VNVLVLGSLVARIAMMVLLRGNPPSRRKLEEYPAPPGQRSNLPTQVGVLKRLLFLPALIVHGHDGRFLVSTRDGRIRHITQKVTRHPDGECERKLISCNQQYAGF